MVVVGAGIIGAACARTLCARGFDVTLIERGAAVGGTSASGEGNLLLSDKLPGPELHLAQYSMGLWAEVTDELRSEVAAEFPSVEYELKGGLVVAFGDGESAALSEFAERQGEHGVRFEVLGVDEARRFEPDLSEHIASAIYYPDDAQVQPVVAAEAFLASARAQGASVLLGTEVIGPLYDDGGALVGVATDKGDVRADQVVIAAGPGSGEVARRLDGWLPVEPRRGFILVTSPMSQRIFHKVYDADYIGAVESDNDALQTSTVVESTQSGTVLIGSSRERVGFDSRLKVTLIAELAAKAIRLFPFLADVTLMRTYCGFRPFIPDHLPVIGEDPSQPGLWFATGHEGAGIGLAPATAAILASLMSGEEPEIASDAFSPARPSLLALRTKVAR